MKLSAAAIVVAIVGVLPFASACTYYNTIYNAERVFERAETSRRTGQDSLAHQLYREVIAKTAEAYRARPESEWAVDALFLLGRSRFRLGELSAAQGALTVAEAGASLRLQSAVRVYLAAVASAGGNDERALELVNDALRGELEGSTLAEAHLLRGRWLLALGHVTQGWWDLDRAAEALVDVRVEAGLERLRWAIRHGERSWAGDAANLLLSYPEGGERRNAMTEVMASATERWGPAVSAEILSAAATSPWDREARGRILLERARLFYAVGDTASASAQAWAVARSLGDAASEARLLLARWHLTATQDLVDAYAVRGILLPASSHPDVARLVDAVDRLEVFTDIGLGDPLGWFAAAEIARDQLSAEYLARGLFLAYADVAPEAPWAPKALLAAIEVSPNEGDRAWLRGRLEGHAESPYVLAAYGGPGAGFEDLEEDLIVRLRELRGR